MGLGVRWTRPVASARVFAEVAPVGAPAIGPAVFMHRPSAAENPSAPLGHHQFDATHITHGVVTGGVERFGIMLEGSWFRGAEPDENRKDIDLGALDSYSGRLSWRRRGWDAQFSGAHLTRTPEWIQSRAGRVGIGGDVSVYRVPPNLAENYGTPVSFHLFLRYRPFAEPLHAVH